MKGLRALAMLPGSAPTHPILVALSPEGLRLWCWGSGEPKGHQATDGRRFLALQAEEVAGVGRVRVLAAGRNGGADRLDYQVGGSKLAAAGTWPVLTAEDLHALPPLEDAAAFWLGGPTGGHAVGWPGGAMLVSTELLPDPGEPCRVLYAAVGGDALLVEPAGGGAAAMLGADGGLTELAANSLADDFVVTAEELAAERPAETEAAWRLLLSRLQGALRRSPPLIVAQAVISRVEQLRRAPPYCPPASPNGAPPPAVVTVVTDLLRAEGAQRGLHGLFSQFATQLLQAAAERAQSAADGDASAMLQTQLQPPADAEAALAEQVSLLAEAAERSRTAQHLLKTLEKVAGAVETIVNDANEAGGRLTAEGLINATCVNLAPPEVMASLDGLRLAAALLHELAWRPVFQPADGAPWTAEGERAEHGRPVHWVFRCPVGRPGDRRVAALVEVLLQRLGSLGELVGPQEQLLDDASALLDALLRGNGLSAVAGREYEDAQYCCIQHLYGADPQRALRLARQYGDHRTRVQHWLQLGDSGQVVSDEAREREAGFARHGRFLLTLVDALFELARHTAADPTAAVAQLVWQRDLLAALHRLASAAPVQAETFLARHGGLRWLHALQEAGGAGCGQTAALSRGGLVPLLRQLRAAEGGRAAPPESVPVGRTMLAVSKLVAHAAGDAAGATALSPLKHGLALAEVAAKLAGGVALDPYELEVGLRACAALRLPPTAVDPSDPAWRAPRCLLCMRGSLRLTARPVAGRGQRRVLAGLWDGLVRLDEVGWRPLLHAGLPIRDLEQALADGVLHHLQVRGCRSWTPRGSKLNGTGRGTGSRLRSLAAVW
jgi:hypothetical protein